MVKSKNKRKMTNVTGRDKFKVVVAGGSIDGSGRGGGSGGGGGEEERVWV